ncbi:MAG: tyrosine--tRNA ligase [bacterium]|nr:tyrosine--tRNA ligase [bacterium]
METKLTSVLERGVEKIYPSKDVLLERMKKGQALRLYQGFDPTAPTLHIGHMAGLRKLRQFQALGHHVIFLVGDFTAMIGDPSNKSATRVKLSRQEVQKNLHSFKDQAARILDFDDPKNPVEIVFNASWLSKLTFEELLDLASHFTVQQLIERDMYQERIRQGRPIAFSEFFYPLMQGYDSVALDVDLEIGGTDQTFNMLAGRTLSKACKNKEKFVLSIKLLASTDGKKMGKTEGNMIAMDERPTDIYGKVMSLSDGFLPLLIELLTDFDIEETIDDPLMWKKKAALDIVRQIHGKEAAASAQQEFERVYQERGVPSTEEMITFSKKTMVALDLVASVPGMSRSEARRLIDQGGITYNGAGVTSSDQQLEIGGILRVGKHRAFQTKIS